jgi:riboflavin transporter FmnP
MKTISTKKLVLSGLFLALGLLMPFLTGQIPSLGNKLLPMHIPVLLCGFICGWPCGLIVGFITPVFRSILLGMPPMFPTAVAMSFELAAYGFLSGLLYKMLPKKVPYIYVSLVTAMICGRIIWGIVSLFLYGLSGKAFTFEFFLGYGFLNAIPGIIVQIVLIPLIIIALKKARLVENPSLVKNA